MLDLTMITPGEYDDALGDLAQPRYRTVIPGVDFWKDMVPCQAACPIHTDAGRYVQLIAQGEYEKAYLTARSPNPFASVCGRVCAAPCEDACRRGKLDGPVSIRALKRFVTEKFGVESLAPDTQTKLLQIETEPGNKTPWHLPMLRISRKNRAQGQKVAVIGGGPAGVSCAHDLALMGYRVTIFEASEAPGGMLIHGIPEFRLNRSVIDKEIDRVIDMGVELKLNAPLRVGFGIQQLREMGFQAIFLSIGAQRGRDLQIEGSELDGVVKAVDFLLNVNHGYRVSLGRRVVIIGGGLVAFDAARMALRTALQEEQNRPGNEGVLATALDAARAAIRAGVADVRMLSLESFDEMPVMRSAQGREEFEEARREGIVFQTQRSAKRFAGENGRVRAIELIGVQRTLLASVVGIGTAMVRSLVPNVLYEPSQRFKAGLPEQFPEGATFLEDQRVFIFREQKTFYAISAVCQHLGCTVKLVSLNRPKTVTIEGRPIEEHREFHCPCHGSKYYGNGFNYAGPAPRPLTWYRLAVSPDDGQLIVDLSEPVNRDFRLSV